jgi:hypothetical protein
MERSDMQNFETRSFAIFWVLALALSVASTEAVRAAESAKPAPPEAHAAAPSFAQSTEEQREAWRDQLLHTPRPKHACYRAVYPDTQWHEVPCSKPPKRYFPPRETVGGGSTHDFSAEPPNTITLAEGSFDNVKATSLSTEMAGEGGVNGPDLYSLQLNTANFPTKVCPASAPKCLGFVQFAYDASSASSFIQYWLINPPSTCPGGWQHFEQWCVQTANSSTSFSPAPTSVSDLKDMRVIGSSASGGEVIVYWKGAMQSSPGDGDVIPDMASHWSEVEYNVFGDGGGGQAVFNTGAAITVRTQVDTGKNVLPTCVPASFTGETNNLDLVGTPTVVPKSKYPAIVFDESNASGRTPSSCSTSLGDTHITTFDGLYYDFQAAGDFVLADLGPDFIVQARQESGEKAFKNPNVMVNTAVAVQMGSNRIAIYDSPVRVVINGKATAVADNAFLTLPGDVYLLRAESSYVVTKSSGEMVRADLNDGWINVSVGLGHRTRSSAHGILASPTGKALSMADGSELKEPVSAADLYKRYAPSWVVKDSASLFAEQTVKYAEPAKVFFAGDLDAATYAKARAACEAAGVTDPVHLDSCILDAAVLKHTTAIKPFSRAIAPHVTVRPVEGVKIEKKP